MNLSQKLLLRSIFLVRNAVPGVSSSTRTTTGKKFLAGLCFTACVLPPENTPFPGSASTPRWTFIRANASCGRKSFVTGISTSLIDRQEKAVIQGCLLLLASALLYEYLSIRLSHSENTGYICAVFRFI